MFPWKFEKNHFFCRDPIVGSKGWIKQMFLEFSKKALVASPCFDRGKKQPTRRSISNWHSALCTTARVRCFFCSRETLPRNHQKPRGFFQLKLLNIDNTHYCHINQPCGHLFKSSQPIQASENFELPKKKKYQTENFEVTQWLRN